MILFESLDNGALIVGLVGGVLTMSPYSSWLLAVCDSSSNILSMWTIATE